MWKISLWFCNAWVKCQFQMSAGKTMCIFGMRSMGFDWDFPWCLLLFSCPVWCEMNHVHPGSIPPHLLSYLANLMCVVLVFWVEMSMCSHSGHRLLQGIIIWRSDFAQSSLGKWVYRAGSVLGLCGLLRVKIHNNVTNLRGPK